jgi:N-acetylglucosamine-6-sulfatase
MLGVGVAGAALLADGGAEPESSGEELRGIERAEAHPRNVILVVTDDQDVRSLEAMPRLKRLLETRGASFSRAIVTYPLCCPSRVTLLTGQHAHNHGSKGNFPDVDGGGYVSLLKPRAVLPAWLQAAGYRTAHVGKWPTAPGSGEPAGWDRWMATLPETAASYYDHALHDGRGGRLAFGSRPRDYHTDVVTRLAVRLIRRWGPRPRPFFLSIAYLAPHLGSGADGDSATRACSPPRGDAPDAPVPAPRHADVTAGEPLPKPPSFDEEDVSDKPAAAVPGRRLRAGQRRAAEREHACRIASLQAVDEGLSDLVGALRAKGLLESTNLVFTSDHGYLLGEHRFVGRKNLPYEESLRVPLLIAGPDVPPGSRIEELVANADLVPTILELTKVEPPRRLRRPIDGQSLMPLLREEEDWTDRAVPIQGRSKTRPTPDGAFEVSSYVGVRTNRYAYFEYRSTDLETQEAAAAADLGAGKRVGAELYDLDLDPYQLESRHRDSRYSATRRKLSQLTKRLQRCVGRSCHVEEVVPDPDT